jgi:hypothetical protein
MNTLIQRETTILPLVIGFALACFALLPTAQAASAAPPLRGEDRGSGNSAAEDVDALNPSTTGVNNTAHGWFSLFSNTTGDSNTADGWSALTFNTTGFWNTANGFAALILNTTGGGNTANGFEALFSNTTANANMADGTFALFNNTTGIDNTASGSAALFSNTTANANTADGFFALFLNTGATNIAVGHQAGSALTTGNNNIDIGNVGVAGESGTIRIGDPASATACFIAGINGATASGGTAVFINANGQLGTLTSSARFKDNIKPMDKASEAILALKPVTFHYKQEIDANGIPQFGLVAEDVAKVNPDLIVRDKEGKPYSVRYEAVNAMLLNEFLKEHRKVEKLEAALRAVNERLAEQDAKIQKVNTELELGKAAPQTVSNNR